MLTKILTIVLLYVAMHALAHIILLYLIIVTKCTSKLDIDVMEVGRGPCLISIGRYKLKFTPINACIDVYKLESNTIPHFIDVLHVTANGIWYFAFAVMLFNIYGFSETFSILQNGIVSIYITPTQSPLENTELVIMNLVVVLTMCVALVLLGHFVPFRTGAVTNAIRIIARRPLNHIETRCGMSGQYILGIIFFASVVTAIVWFVK